MRGSYARFLCAGRMRRSYAQILCAVPIRGTTGSARAAFISCVCVCVRVFLRQFFRATSTEMFLQFVEYSTITSSHCHVFISSRFHSVFSFFFFLLFKTRPIFVTWLHTCVYVCVYFCIQYSNSVYFRLAFHQTLYFNF